MIVLVEPELIGTHGHQIRNSSACEHLLSDKGQAHVQVIYRWLRNAATTMRSCQCIS